MRRETLDAERGAMMTHQQIPLSLSAHPPSLRRLRRNMAGNLGNPAVQRNFGRRKMVVE